MLASRPSRQTTPARENLLQVLRQHPLFSFFFIAYAFSWILTIPFILADWGFLQGNYTLIFVLKSFGPFLAAYVMLQVTEGPDGPRRLRQSLRHARVGGVWYLFSLLVIPAMLLLGIILQPGTLAGFRGLTPAILVTYLASFVAVAFGGGPLGEEPGWRGFALPRLQTRYGPLWGTLLLSMGWCFWHLPDFLTTAQGGGPGTGWGDFFVNLPIFLLLVTALAIIITWVFNHTQGSVFMALLVHTGVNVVQVALVPLFPAVSVTQLNLAAVIGYGLPALLIVILTRGRLGYQPNQELPEHERLKGSRS